MSACTFFGHRDAPNEISDELRSVLEKLVVSGVDMFYVGNQGGFDYIVKKELEKLKNDFPYIKYYVVLAYMPCGEKQEEYDTLYPEGLEKVPRRFAITKRNRWMIDSSDYVVAYVKYVTGGASQFVSLAEKKGKTIINIAEKTAYPV